MVSGIVVHAHIAVLDEASNVVRPGDAVTKINFLSPPAGTVNTPLLATST
jgi:hypothetical protein